MRNIKKISVIFAALILIVSITYVDAMMAVPDNGVMPCWEYMNSISLDLYFNGTNGTADMSVTHIYGITTRIEATLCVYRRTGGDWTLVASTTNSSSGALSIDLDFTAVYGQMYKAEATVTAYGENGSETDTVSYQANCPKQEDA